MIYWSEFTWEAFATLFAGLSAVVAAFCVAKTQVTIQNKLGSGPNKGIPIGIML
jgi:hypothetical protein